MRWCGTPRISAAVGLAVPILNDVKRVVRALEIYEVSGRKKSEQNDELKPRFDYLAVAAHHGRFIGFKQPVNYGQSPLLVVRYRKICVGVELTKIVKVCRQSAIKRCSKA